MKMNIKQLKYSLVAFALASSFNSQSAQVFVTDIVVQGSACIGFDCVNGENFGADTLRLKENNLRIHFNDTSSSASFPSNDWRIVINDQSNGGSNYFGIEDSTAGTYPFRVMAGAGNNALYVDAQGDVGLNTSNPVVELHIADGDTPTVRLEQTGSSGFTPQTWDIAGNETNFFIRDVTNGSELPFKIRPGADDNALYIAENNNIGFGTASPNSSLEIVRSNTETPTLKLNRLGSESYEHSIDSNGYYRIKNTGLHLTHFESSNDSPVQLRLDTASDNRRIIAVDGSNQKSQILLGDGEIELRGGIDGAQTIATFTATNFSVPGSITVNSTVVHPDYVFDPSYSLMPLEQLNAFISENRHLPEIPSADDVSKNGINMTELQIKLLKKVEELTLYILEQEKKIKILENRLH